MTLLPAAFLLHAVSASGEERGLEECGPEICRSSLYPCWNGNYCHGLTENGDCGSSLRCNDGCEAPGCSETLVPYTDEDGSEHPCECNKCEKSRVLFEGVCHRPSELFRDVTYHSVYSNMIYIKSEFLYSELESLSVDENCVNECFTEKLYEISQVVSAAYFRAFEENKDFLFVLPYRRLPSKRGLRTLPQFFRSTGDFRNLKGTAIVNIEPKRFFEPYQFLHIIASYWSRQLGLDFNDFTGKKGWLVSGMNSRGQLGGWARDKWTCAEPWGRYPSKDLPCDTNTIRVPTQEGSRTKGSDGSLEEPLQYSLFELMLMGLLTPEEIANQELIHCKDAVPWKQDKVMPQWNFSGDSQIQSYFNCSSVEYFTPATLPMNLDESIAMSKNSRLNLAFIILFPGNADTMAVEDDLELLNNYLRRFPTMFKDAAGGLAEVQLSLTDVEYRSDGGVMVKQEKLKQNSATFLHPALLATILSLACCGLLALV